MIQPSNLVSIRRATRADLQAITGLFQQAVLKATASDYDYHQRRAWAVRGDNPERWKTKVDTLHFLLAEQRKQLVGFGGIDTRGYLDLLYVHYNYQRKGIATCLLDALEAWARQQVLTMITTDASLTARPFFEHQGYRATKEQQKALGDVILVNYRMEKLL